MSEDTKTTEELNKAAQSAKKSALAAARRAEGAVKEIDDRIAAFEEKLQKPAENATPPAIEFRPLHKTLGNMGTLTLEDLGSCEAAQFVLSEGSLGRLVVNHFDGKAGAITVVATAPLTIAGVTIYR